MNYSVLQALIQGSRPSFLLDVAAGCGKAASQAKGGGLRVLA